MNSKYSTTRVVIVLMAILSIVLAVVCILRTDKNVEEDKPQSDLSDYGNDIPSVNQGDDTLVFEDDGTVEMDSIPNDAMPGDELMGDEGMGDAAGETPAEVAPETPSEGQ